MNTPPLPSELPSVTALLTTDVLQAEIARHGPGAITEVVRDSVATLRAEVLAGTRSEPIPPLDLLAAAIAEQLQMQRAAGLRGVLNATGILLHTNLGRAPLADEACRAVLEVARGYANVELDLRGGGRSHRSVAVADSLRRLTGAEAAHVVNNNAGALGLALGALAAGREIVVSHGELIEIGGGFRLPEVIEMFGARLRAVGSTNKTRARDYEEAIGPETAVLLCVHPSNYRITGFTETPRVEELAEIAHRHKVPLVHDIGSGALIDLSEWGFPDEPVASQSVAAGADLVLFSGDKLLGGPQCGVIVGRRELVDQVNRHPLNRALRVDKMTLAALRATLLLYEQGALVQQQTPLLRMLTVPLAEIETRTRQLVARWDRSLDAWQATATPDEALLGGGTTPQQALPSWCATLAPRSGRCDEFARALRLGNPAVVPRLRQDQLVLSLHAVLPEDDELLAAAVEQAARRLEAS